MTHEIMNTITPIASLSDALSKDSSLDTQAGLETISASSKELIRFVGILSQFHPHGTACKENHCGG